MAKDFKGLFTQQVDCRGRFYFFDIRQAADGRRYLVITESQQRHDGLKHSRVFVFEENLAQFNEGLDRAMEFIADG